MWVQAGVSDGSSTLLAFSTPENPMQLWVHQYGRVLVLKRMVGDATRPHGTIGIDGLFGREPVFITITSGPENTSIYIDGRRAESFARFRLENDCTGRLVVGASTVDNDTWSGELFGLAVYQTQLSPAQVLQHYETWSTRGRLELAENEAPLALYFFDEHAGNVAHNAVRPGIDLSIPNRYSLLHQRFLEPFWKEYRPTRGYWIDVLINVFGFIPLGLVFCSFWSSVRPIKHPRLATIALGFAVSLTIELLQSYLPNRSSGTTDLLTNTFGTLLGVSLYAAAKAIFWRLRSPRPNT